MPSSAWPPPYDPTSDPRLVPVVIHGAQWGPSYALERISDNGVVTQCPSSCTMHVWPGRYRLHVSDTDETKGGTRVVTIDGPSTIFVDSPSREKRWTGLEIAVAGHVATVAGALLLLGDLCVEQCRRDSDGAGARGVSGLVLFGGGIAASAIGWVMFAKGSKPEVNVTPQVSRPQGSGFVAPLRSLSLGYDPANHSGGVGASWSF